MIRYYDFGREGKTGSAVMVAAADREGYILHYYKGYINSYFNRVTLYPYKPAKGKSFIPGKKTIHIDDLRPREELRRLQEETQREQTPRREQTLQQISIFDKVSNI